MIYELELEAILGSFHELELNPTLSITEIAKAFRTKAAKLHPDTSSGEAQKKALEEKFKKLVNARDIAIIASKDPELLNKIGSYKESSQTNTSSTNISEQHFKANANDSNIKNSIDEWELFIQDKDAYFSIFNSTNASVKLYLNMFILSHIYTIGLFAMALIPLVAILLLLTFPVAGIAFAVIALIVFVLFAVKIFTFIDKKLEKIFTSTPYPRTIFITGWLLANIMIITLWIHLDYNCKLVWYFAGTNFAYLFIFDEYKEKIRKYEYVCKQYKFRTQQRVADIIAIS